jgi:phenylpropionate dioxygenase-like ring-hydroxylating dioxygenase large terminal subunit
MLTESRMAAAAQDQLTAGGSDPARFDCQEAWYPIFYLADLDRAKLHKFTLLNRDLVIWWDRQALGWRAFVDQCPHRRVPLSEGRIAQDGLLECPYHGWAFHGNGDCDRIPQQVPGGTAHQSSRACATALPTAEQQDLLFVYAGQPENADRVQIPVIEPLESDPEGWICLNTWRDLPYDALTLLENVLDSSHLPFTHHRSVGNRANAAPVELELVATGKSGFQGFWAEGPRRGKLGSQTTTFIAPSLMWHDLTSRQFGRTLTVVYATPMRKGQCRLFARFPFKFSSKLPAFVLKLTPQWYSHLGNHNVLEDDQLFLHAQERYLADRDSAQFAKACYLPTRADTFVLALRQWVTEFSADPFPEQALPPRKSSTELLDRYHSHTIHCASCRGALRNIQRLQVGLLIVSAVIWSLVPLVGFIWGELTLPIVIIMAMMPLGAIATWFGLGNLERQFYQGRAVPLRNLPEKR